MSPEEVTEIDHSLYYEVLNILIPRFLRVIGDGTQGTICQAFTKLGERLGPNKNLLSVVEWFHDATFFSLPGYLAIHELDPLSIGLFPFDIASACAVSALGIKMKEKSIKVLDLCCCPGGKTQMIHELLNKSSSHGDEGANATIIGVDISKPRLQVCISLLDRTARFKFMENSKAMLDVRREQTTERSCEISATEGISCSSNLTGAERVIDIGSKREEKNTGQRKEKPRLLLFNGDGTRFGLETLGSLLFDSKIQDDEFSHIFGRDKKGSDSNIRRASPNSADVNAVPNQSSYFDETTEVEVGLRKRKNKSARQREQRKILLVEKYDLREIFSAEKKTAECSPDRPRVAVLIGGSKEELFAEVEAEGTRGAGREREKGKRKEKGKERGGGKGGGIEESLLSPTPLNNNSTIEVPKESPLLNEGTFDYILVDAECSHDGSYRHMRYVSEESAHTDTLNCNEQVVIGCVNMASSSSSSGGSSSSSSSSGSSSTHTTMNKPGSAKSYIGSDRVAERGEIVDLQKKLLENGFRLLKPSSSECSASTSATTSTTTSATHSNPSLVYSTCSLDEKQNEGVVKWLLETHEDAELCPLGYNQLCSSSCSDMSLAVTHTHHYGIVRDDVHLYVAADVCSAGDTLYGCDGKGDGEGEGGKGVEGGGGKEGEFSSGEVKGTEEAKTDSRDLGLALALIRMSQVDLLRAVRAMGGRHEATELLKGYSRLLSRHWSAQRMMPGQIPLPSDSDKCSNSNSISISADPASAASAVSESLLVHVTDEQLPPHPHLPGTVRLSLLNGTSGIFIAKIRKKKMTSTNC